MFDLLRYFVENPDRLISRDELIDAVWEGRIVSDATISTRINAVRKALGDSGQRQAFVQTLPRRGFKFVASVEIIDAQDVALPATPDDVVIFQFGQADSAVEQHGGHPVFDAEFGLEAALTLIESTAPATGRGRKYDTAGARRGPEG